jgi:hypothetical protein
MPDQKLIYEWNVPKDHPNFSGYDDLPESYRVFECDRASAGIIVEAKYRGEWITNPWNTRTLIRHFLEDKLSKPKQKKTCPECGGDLNHVGGCENPDCSGPPF